MRILIAILALAIVAGCSSEDSTADGGVQEPDCRVSVAESGGATCASKSCGVEIAIGSSGSGYKVCTQRCVVGGAKVCASDETCFSDTGVADEGFCTLKCQSSSCKAPLTCRGSDACY